MVKLHTDGSNYNGWEGPRRGNCGTARHGTPVGRVTKNKQPHRRTAYSRKRSITKFSVHAALLPTIHGKSSLEVWKSMAFLVPKTQQEKRQRAPVPKFLNCTSPERCVEKQAAGRAVFRPLPCLIRIYRSRPSVRDQRLIRRERFNGRVRQPRRQISHQ